MALSCLASSADRQQVTTVALEVTGTGRAKREKARPKPGFRDRARKWADSQPVEDLVGPETLEPLQRPVQFLEVLRSRYRRPVRSTGYGARTGR